MTGSSALHPWAQRTDGRRRNHSACDGHIRDLRDPHESGGERLTREILKSISSESLALFEGLGRSQMGHREGLDHRFSSRHPARRRSDSRHLCLLCGGEKGLPQP